MSTQPVLLGGQWRKSASSKTFQATNPANKQPIDEQYPVSGPDDCEAALAAASAAYEELRSKSGTDIAAFLEQYAELIEARADELVAMANRETALPVKPRLAAVELPRTTNQLRLAAKAARDGSWRQATIDTAANIRSCFEPIGPVVVLGPNNFPFAFNSVAGGDFAAAIAAGNPVIGKANSSHPGTTRLLAEQALAAAQATNVPRAIVQMLYRLDHADGNRLIADRRVGAVGFTGSRAAGLNLKTVADAVGKPIYLELSSINPVAILPGALPERAAQIVDEFTTSCLMGAGQLCTNPGLVLMLAGNETDEFIDMVAAKFDAAPVGTLLSAGVNKSLASSIAVLLKAGATSVTKSQSHDASRFCHANTLLRVNAGQFIADAETFQTEAFGNCSLVVVSDDIDQLLQVLHHLDGNLTGCVYSDTAGSDDAIYARIAPALSQRVGRLLNDKMPTGVAVSSAMNHGGPFPATGHPGFTAVGLPASIHRFAKLQCYDNVRHDRLPVYLQNKNPSGSLWRMIDGNWTRADIGG